MLPEETAYFPTVLTKYGQRGRREQFDYLTRCSLANVLFGGALQVGSARIRPPCPPGDCARRSRQAAFDPANARRDLLAMLMECYAGSWAARLDTVRHWVEKTPANRDHLGAIFHRFPHAKVLLTLARSPRVAGRADSA